MSIEVIDNFLNDSSFKKTKEYFFGDELPWYYYPFKTDNLESNSNLLYESQMVHLFYNNMIPSNFFSIVSPILESLNIASLIKVKANLTPCWNNIVNFSPHLDNHYVGSKTAVFYLNTNNGYTQFTDTEDRVDSIENRILIFPSHLSHFGTTHTDTKSRIVVNINFFDGK